MNKLFSKSESIYVIDVETTGPDVFKNDVLYIYIAPLFGESPELELYIKYTDHALIWGNVASKYFKSYSKAWNENAVNCNRAWETLVEFFERTVKAEEIILSGHNVAFDYLFLKKLASLNNAQLPKKVSHRLLDVHSILLYHHLKGLIPKSALGSLGSIKYFGLDYSSEKRHSAREDVKYTKKVLLKLLDIKETY